MCQAQEFSAIRILGVDLFDHTVILMYTQADLGPLTFALLAHEYASIKVWTHINEELTQTNVSRFQVLIAVSRILGRGFEGRGPLSLIGGSVYIVWAFRYKQGSRDLGYQRPVSPVRAA